MPMHTASANELLKLLLTAVAMPNLADNAAATPNTQLFWALHTANPGVGGTQATSEIAYTGYARIAVARLPAAWNIVGAVATLIPPAEFTESGGGAGGTVTHISIGKALSGAGQILWSGTYTPNLVVALGVTPRIKAGTAITVN